MSLQGSERELWARALGAGPVRGMWRIVLVQQEGDAPGAMTGFSRVGIPWFREQPGPMI